MQMKYIVVLANDYRTGEILHELPIMFPHVAVHKDMYDGTRYAVADGGDFRVSEVLGAGFCSVGVDKDGNGTVKCWGESESLGVKSRGKPDEEAFARCANLSSTRIN